VDGECKLWASERVGEGDTGDPSFEWAEDSSVSLVSPVYVDVPPCSADPTLLATLDVLPLCSGSEAVEEVTFFIDELLAVEVLTLFGPRTLPSFAYSQTRPRLMHRLQAG
jgi:hypothetical protein